MSNSSPSSTPARGSPVTLRIVLPQPSREDRPASPSSRISFGRVGQRHVVHLDVLARGDVALAQRHVLLDHVRERVELVGRHAAERQLDADHLHVGLALAVDALLEAELDELVVLELALQEARGLGVEVVELALEDRDHVPRNVLDHLGFSSDPVRALCIGPSFRSRADHEI